MSNGYAGYNHLQPVSITTGKRAGAYNFIYSGIARERMKYL